MKFLFFVLSFCLLALGLSPASASVNHARQPMVASIELGSITANGDVYGVFLPKKSKIVGAYLVDSTGIAASDTNYVQVSLQQGSTVIAEIDTRAAHENGLTALTPKALNVVSAASSPAAGSYLKATYVEAGTIGMTTAKLFIVYYPL